eukprot:2968549-Prymnesium_polylepis.1
MSHSPDSTVCQSARTSKTQPPPRPGRARRATFRLGQPRARRDPTARQTRSGRRHNLEPGTNLMLGGLAHWHRTSEPAASPRPADRGSLRSTSHTRRGAHPLLVNWIGPHHPSGLH